MFTVKTLHLFVNSLPPFYRERESKFKNFPLFKPPKARRINAVVFIYILQYIHMYAYVHITVFF